MKQTLRFAKWLWFLPVAMIVALGWILSGTAKERKVRPALENEPVGTNRARSSLPGSVPASGKLLADHHHLYDASPTGSGFLISKVEFKHNTGEDLWLRDSTGQERFIATEVKEARFSPDGSKIAYSTSRHQVFIETLAGEHLAEIPRACAPIWRADSVALNFTAILSPEYPEIQQSRIYDLNSGQIAESRNGN